MTHLKELIRFRGVKQTWLAEFCGMSVWRLCRIVNGKQKATEAEEESLSKALQEERMLVFPK